jgi:hypothetical protein
MSAYGNAEQGNEIVEFWNICEIDKAPFVHPKDKEQLHDLKEKFDFDNHDLETFILSSRFGNFTDNRFHLSLLPSPYIGSIASADVVILQLNPGFNFSDFYAEYSVSSFRKMKERTLRQDFFGVEFPFIFLDPQFCWHPGFLYWERKFRKILRQLAERRFNGNYRCALKELSRRLLCLELVPYHSANFDVDMKKIEKLPSTIIMKHFVKNEIEPSALQGEKVLIVMRQAMTWKVNSSMPNVFVFAANQARGAHLTITDDGSGSGAAILNRLLA